MFLGRVIGKVVATQKVPSITGIRLRIVQPFDHDRRPFGDPVVAADVVSAGEGDTIYWVDAREAPNALPEKHGPVDATIVGIADRINV